MGELRSQLEGVTSSDEVWVKKGLSTGGRGDMANGGHIDIRTRSKKKVDADACLDHFTRYLAPRRVFGLEQCLLLVSIVELRVFTEEEAIWTPGREGCEGTDDFPAGFFEGGEGSAEGRKEGGLGIFNVKEKFGEGGEKGFDYGSAWEMIRLVNGVRCEILCTWIRRDPRIDLR